MEHSCASPGLYFDCPNGFRGCCTVNPCVQEEPVCPCNSVLEHPILSYEPLPSATSANQSTLTAELDHPTVTASLIDTFTPFPSSTADATQSSLGNITALPPMASASANPSVSAGTNPTKAGSIAGGVIGSMACLAGVAGLAYWLLRRRGYKITMKHKFRKEDTEKKVDRMSINIVEQINRVPSPAVPSGVGQALSQYSHDMFGPSGAFHVQRKPVPRTDPEAYF